MIMDKQLVCWDNVALTVDAVSDAIDLVTTADISRGIPLRARLQVDTTFTSGGAATGDFQLVESPNADLSAATILYSTGALALATLAAGYVAIDIVVPRTSKRYLGFAVDNNAAVWTGGKVTAAIVTNTETPQASRIVGNTALG